MVEAEDPMDQLLGEFNFRVRISELQTQAMAFREEIEALKGRINQLEDLQLTAGRNDAQLDSLNDRIAKLETEHLAMRRRIYSDRLISLERRDYLHQWNHVASFPPDVVGAQRRCSAEVQTFIATVRGRLDNSLTPETELEGLGASINESLQHHGYDPILWI